QVLAGNGRLRELTLDNCAIGNRGAEALAGMTGLQRLRLPDNDIGDRGALALAANPRLLHLDLRGNSGISQPVRQQLAEQARATGRVILV
ncbi:type III effector, partial [Burkholderia sp. Cy-647]|nr:type III effector [Burkholderia sp. Cy-647]